MTTLLIDPPHDAVIAAFRQARERGLSTVDCYKAGVEVWKRWFPEQHPSYAAQQAVRIILEAQKDLWKLPQDASVPSSIEL